MPRYRVLDGFMLGHGYGDVWPGQVVELQEQDAQPAVRLGRLQLDQGLPKQPADADGGTGAQAPVPGRTVDEMTTRKRPARKPATTRRPARSAAEEV